MRAVIDRVDDSRFVLENNNSAVKPNLNHSFRIRRTPVTREKCKYYSSCKGREKKWV